MPKETLAIDIDEVLFPFLENFLLHYNGAEGTTHTINDFNEYHFSKPLGLSLADCVQRVYDYTALDHAHIDPIQGVEDALERLSTRYTLEVVTSRPSKYEVNTWKWIQEKLPDRFSAMKMIGYSLLQNEKLTKAEVCAGIGAVALIDDVLDNVLPCVDVNIEGILFGDYPWNRYPVLPSGVVRCANWQEVLEHFGV